MPGRGSGPRSQPNAEEEEGQVRGADPAARHLVECLQEGPKTVGDISRDIDSAIANVSHHLKQLRFAGLVYGQSFKRDYNVVPDIRHSPIHEEIGSAA